MTAICLGVGGKKRFCEGWLLMTPNSLAIFGGKREPGRVNSLKLTYFYDRNGVVWTIISLKGRGGKNSFSQGFNQAPE